VNCQVVRASIVRQEQALGQGQAAGQLKFDPFGYFASMLASLHQDFCPPQISLPIPSHSASSLVHPAVPTCVCSAI
jgi:hypothetical protein